MGEGAGFALLVSCALDVTLVGSVHALGKIGCGHDDTSRDYTSHDEIRYALGVPRRYKPIPNLTPEDVSRFRALVVEAGHDSCWFGLSGDATCYSTFYINGNAYYKHRVAYFLAHGLLPVGLVCHKCNVKGCLNTRHLYDGTDASNAADRELARRI